MRKSRWYRLMGSIVDTNPAKRVIDIALLCTLPENSGRHRIFINLDVA